MIDRVYITSVKLRIEAALRTIEEATGMKFEMGSVSYTDNTATFKVVGSEVSEDGEVFSQEAEDFKRHAASYGLQPSDLGKEFNSRGNLFVITGLKSRRRKYPISATEVRSGKAFKFGADSIAAKLALINGA